MLVVIQVEEDVDDVGVELNGFLFLLVSKLIVKTEKMRMARMVVMRYSLMS